jgi:hypothetical protein
MALARKSKQAQQRPWRPDFRDAQELPDTKVIRTGFLYNLIAVAVTLAVATTYLIKEYNLQSLAAMIGEIQQEVIENTAENRAILDANKRFNQNASIMQEIVAFDSRALDFPAFLSELSGILPEGSVLTSIELRPADTNQGKNANRPFIAEIVGRISGAASAPPSQVIAGFQAAISGIPALDGKRLEMDLSRFNRNNELGHFEFTLLVLIYSQNATES